MWYDKEEVFEKAKELILETDVVLEIGPGIRPQYYFKPKVHICIEPHIPYIEKVQKKRDDLIFLQANWRAIYLFHDRVVDSVLAFDVIEHLEKEDGHALLEEAVRVARKQIVIFTPLGFVEQTEDAWNMKGEYWQKHRSGWTPEDFEGWDLACCKDYHGKCGAFWAVKNL